MTPANSLRQVLKLCLLPYGVITRDRRPGVTILGYHRVAGRTTTQLDLPHPLFEWQMAYLRRERTVVNLDDVAATAGVGAKARDAVVITFDDGYGDVYDHAFPILRRYRLPATIYLATAFIEEGRPFPVEASGSTGGLARPLTWDQVRTMQRSGLITIGAHTHTHADLSALGVAGVAREVEESNRLIALRVGVPPIHFAYPWGRTSAASRTVVSRTYRTAAVGGTRKNPYASLDLSALRRVPVQRSDGRVFFKLKVESYLQGEDWVRTRADRRRRLWPDTSPVDGTR